MTKPTIEAQRKARNREHDAKRREAQPWRALYDTRTWQQIRLAHFREHPFCEMCKPLLVTGEGKTFKGLICDHIRPHRGDPALFFDRSNLQTLCKPHHDSTKQAEEKGRKRVQIGPDGWPVEEL